MAITSISQTSSNTFGNSQCFNLSSFEAEPEMVILIQVIFQRLALSEGFSGSRKGRE